MTKGPDRQLGYTFGKYKWAMGVKGTWHKIVVIDGEEYPMCMRHKLKRFVIVKRITRRPTYWRDRKVCTRCDPGPNFNKKRKVP